ncbi:MAG: hypothetical protein VW583_04340, partial [Betaproteobacteria bacterium]
MPLYRKLFAAREGLIGGFAENFRKIYSITFPRSGDLGEKSPVSQMSLGLSAPDQGLFNFSVKGVV